MRNALIRYRIMAYLVGTLLVILMLVGVPLKYFGHDGRLVTWIGIPHGWLYMILLITAFDLGRRAKWTWRRLILIALAGTIPFLSFVAERSATKDVRPEIARLEAETAAARTEGSAAAVGEQVAEEPTAS
jgi:integral membrane protein